jgi:hypothetical protein
VLIGAEFFDWNRREMKTTGVRVSLGLFGLCLTFAFGLVVPFQSIQQPHGIIEPVIAQTADKPRFRLLGGSFMGDHADYTFQTPPEEKTYADDCPSCEVGNAVIFAEFGCPNKSKYLFESNTSNANEVVEKIPVLDKSGSYVGEKRLIVFKNKEQQVVGARLFWIEGKDFWAVQAPTIALTKALGDSDEYRDVRKKVAEEIKSYVPIQNANTIGKDPCADFIQRRIQH